MSKTISLINGPNLNLLGRRDPGIYGSDTLEEIVKSVSARAKEFSFELDAFQANSEGALIDRVQAVLGASAGIIINPGAYSHTSVALRDALELATQPVIEVHLSNIYRRESFRHQSYISQVADGVISGLGSEGYLLAVAYIAQRVSK